MSLAVIQGIIKRRILVNYRADPDVVQRIIPDQFRPKLQGGNAVVGICLIRLERMRPAGLPAFCGLSSENAAHRIAVEWDGGEAVYVPRRDSDSLINRVSGGRLFAGEYGRARFDVVDDGAHIDFKMKSVDGQVSVRVDADEAQSLPKGSCFGSLDEASAFFEPGSLGYSPARNEKLEGILLQVRDWRVEPLSVTDVHSSFYEDESQFPPGSIEFDHALIMRNIHHEWRSADGIGP